jgi:hypothetical protein
MFADDCAPLRELITEVSDGKLELKDTSEHRFLGEFKLKPDMTLVPAGACPDGFLPSDFLAVDVGEGKKGVGSLGQDSLGQALQQAEALLKAQPTRDDVRVPVFNVQNLRVVCVARSDAALTYLTSESFEWGQSPDHERSAIRVFAALVHDAAVRADKLHALWKCVDGYTIHRLLGQGTSATVYAALSAEGKEHAVKIFGGVPMQPAQPSENASRKQEQQSFKESGTQLLRPWSADGVAFSSARCPVPFVFLR